MSVIQSGSNSAELSNSSPSYIPANASIRCLRDQMIVEPLPVIHSDLIEVVEHTKPVRGIVRVIGPGCYPKIYNHPDKHRRTSMRESKHFLPTEVKVGDIVELGSPQFERGYNFPQFVWGDKTHVICRELDVSGVVING